MGIRINQNVMAMNAYRNLTTTEGQLSRSLERLSSGFRINRAADDAAGLVISEGLRAQVNGLKMATRNAQDGVSVVQTAEGALTETHAILQRMRELAVQAASTGSSDQPSRDAAQVEVSQLRQELDRIANTTKFGEQTLLNGQYGVTQAKASTATTDADNDDLTEGIAFNAINWAGTESFDIELNGDGNVHTVTLTGALDLSAATAASAADAQDLEDALNDALVSSLATANADYEALSFNVELDGEGTGYVVSLNGAKGNEFDLTDTDLLTDVNIADGAYTSTGSGGVFQVGSGTSADDKINIAIGDMTSGASGLNLTAVDVSDSAVADANITLIDDAITEVSTLRGNLGAYQNRFERTISNLSVTTENLSASESRIRDTDMASEMMSFTRAQILQQAGTAMLAQANSVPQSVLQLLQ
jgi:flagellin